MVNHFYYYIVILFLFQGYIFSDNYHMSMEKERAVNNVLNIVDKTLNKRYGMRCVGSGGAMMYEVEDLSLTFWINRPLNKEEARKIVIDSAEEFLNIINKNAALRRFLKIYPFQPKNISLAILIHNYDGTQLYHPNLSVAATTCGKVLYLTDSNDDSWAYKEEIEETFDEAKQIVEQQKQQKLQKFD